MDDTREYADLAPVRPRSEGDDLTTDEGHDAPGLPSERGDGSEATERERFAAERLQFAAERILRGGFEADEEIDADVAMYEDESRRREGEDVQQEQQGSNSRSRRRSHREENGEEREEGEARSGYPELEESSDDEQRRTDYTENEEDEEGTGSERNPMLEKKTVNGGEKNKTSRAIDPVAMQIEMELASEPSVLETRLRSGGNFNKGDWSSDELRLLYEGIKERGVSEEALIRILNNSALRRTRTIDEVTEKVNDIRLMNDEHRVERMKAEKRRWRHHPPPITVEEGSKIWSQTMAELARKRRLTRRVDLTRKYIISYMTERMVEMRSAQPSSFSYVDPRPNMPTQSKNVIWHRIYRLFRDAMRGVDLERRVQDLNPMEAVVVLSCLDELEGLAASRVTPARQSELHGILCNLLIGDLRDFEVRAPLSKDRPDDMIQPFLDPLSLDEFDSIELEDDEPEEEVNTNALDAVVENPDSDFEIDMADASAGLDLSVASPWGLCRGGGTSISRIVGRGRGGGAIGKRGGASSRRGGASGRRGGATDKRGAVLGKLKAPPGRPPGRGRNEIQRMMQELDKSSSDGISTTTEESGEESEEEDEEEGEKKVATLAKQPFMAAKGVRAGSGRKTPVKKPPPPRTLSTSSVKTKLRRGGKRHEEADDRTNKDSESDEPAATPAKRPRGRPRLTKEERERRERSRTPMSGEKRSGGKRHEEADDRTDKDSESDELTPTPAKRPRGRPRLTQEERESRERSREALRTPGKRGRPRMSNEAKAAAAAARRDMSAALSAVSRSSTPGPSVRARDSEEDVEKEHEMVERASEPPVTPGKRRGRPSKAEMEAKKAEAAAARRALAARRGRSRSRTPVAAEESGESDEEWNASQPVTPAKSDTSRTARTPRKTPVKKPPPRAKSTSSQSVQSGADDNDKTNKDAAERTDKDSGDSDDELTPTPAKRPRGRPRLTQEERESRERSREAHRTPGKRGRPRKTEEAKAAAEAPAEH